MIVAVVSSVCRHGWESLMGRVATMMLMTLMTLTEDCNGLLRWAVSCVVSLWWWL